jgi:hypothetical protein
MATTRITNPVLREAVRSSVARVLPTAGTLTLTAIGRRDDARIAMQGAFCYLDADRDLHKVYVVATLDGVGSASFNVEQVLWATTDAASDIDFMRVAL